MKFEKKADALEAAFGNNVDVEVDPLVKNLADPLGRMKVSDGFAGEEIGKGVLFDQTGIALQSLQNTSNQGADGLAIDHDSKTIYVCEIKWSQNGVMKARTAGSRSPEDRAAGWADKVWPSEFPENQAKRAELKYALSDPDYKVVGIHIRTGFRTVVDPVTNAPRVIQQARIERWTGKKK